MKLGARWEWGETNQRSQPKTAPGCTNPPSNKAELPAVSVLGPGLHETCPRLAPRAQAVTAPISGAGGPRERRAPGATPPPRATFTCRGRRRSDARNRDSAETRAAAGPLLCPRRWSCAPRARSHRQPVPGPAATGTPSGGPHWRQAGYLAWGHFSPPPPGRQAQLRLRTRDEPGAKAEPQRFFFRTMFPRRRRRTAAYGVREGPIAVRLEKAGLREALEG